MQSHRLHHLDWLRVIAFGLLVLFHTGMIFVPWRFHIQAAQTSEMLMIVMSWMHAWRMPLLFLISGMGTAFALGTRSGGAFIRQRVKRLLIPLLFGMFVVVPPQIYVERIADYDSFWAFYPTVLALVPYPMGGSMSWHHLWFVLYLFFYSLALLPLLLWVRRSSTRWSPAVYRWAHRGGLAWFFAPLFVLHAVTMPFFPEFTHTLIDDWGRVVHFGMFFAAGFVIAVHPPIMARLRTKRRRHLMISVLWLVPFFAIRLFDWPTRPMLFGYDFLYWVPTSVVAWYFCLALLGYGYAALSRPSGLLTYLNDAVYPFYIWHQTVTVVLGAWVIHRVEGVALPFILIAAGTYVGTLAIYHVLIRPYPFMRFLHGLKPRAADVSSPSRASASSASDLLVRTHLARRYRSTFLARAEIGASCKTED
ncbi:MAG: acyltransferase family protein [Myxococcota bacterium]